MPADPVFLVFTAPGPGPTSASDVVALPVYHDERRHPPSGGGDQADSVSPGAASGSSPRSWVPPMQRCDRPQARFSNVGHQNGQPDDSTDYSHIDHALRVIHHNVTVTGSDGVTTTVMITARRGQVWLSIQPPFTWEAMMTPGKADEVMRTLERAGVTGRHCRNVESSRHSSVRVCKFCDRCALQSVDDLRVVLCYSQLLVERLRVTVAIVSSPLHPTTVIVEGDLTDMLQE